MCVFCGKISALMPHSRCNIFALRQYIALKWVRCADARYLAFVAGIGEVLMDAQHNCDEDDRGVKSLRKRPYAEPVLVALGSFSELTLNVGSRGNNDGGRQSGRRSTRA